MASKTAKKNDRAAVDAGFLLRLKALEALNKTLPAELRLSMNLKQITDILPNEKAQRLYALRRK